MKSPGTSSCNTLSIQRCTLSRRAAPIIVGATTGYEVRVYNARGACLAGAVVTDAVMPGVVKLSCGSWYDPADASEQPDQPFLLFDHAQQRSQRPDGDAMVFAGFVEKRRRAVDEQRRPAGQFLETGLGQPERPRPQGVAQGPLVTQPLHHGHPDRFEGHAGELSVQVVRGLPEIADRDVLADVDRLA